MCLPGVDPGQYRRLQMLLELPPGKGADGETVLKSVAHSSAMSFVQKSSYVEKVTRVVSYTLIIFVAGTVYFLCCLPWGTDMVYSYSMLYGAPPTFVTVDWMYLLLLGQRYWRPWCSSSCTTSYHWPLCWSCAVSCSPATYFNTPAAESQ